MTATAPRIASARRRSSRRRRSHVCQVERVSGSEAPSIGNATHNTASAGTVAMASADMFTDHANPAPATAGQIQCRRPFPIPTIAANATASPADAKVSVMPPPFDSAGSDRAPTTTTTVDTPTQNRADASATSHPHATAATPIMTAVIACIETLLSPGWSSQAKAPTMYMPGGLWSNNST